MKRAFTRPAQCAALPWRVRAGVLEILLVTPRGGRGWILPKGKVKPSLGRRESARREAEEEGGVRGELSAPPFGRYRHGGRLGPKVDVFLLRVTRELDAWPEDHQRERRWATADEVSTLVLDPGLAALLADAVRHLTE